MLAASVLNGLLANDSVVVRDSLKGWRINNVGKSDLAAVAVSLADELLAELERTAPKEEPPKYRPHPFSPSISRNNPTP